MKPTQKKLRVEIYGEQEQLSVLMMFLRKLEFLGNIGSTRTLHLWYDGDGGARLQVYFPDVKGKIPVRGYSDLEDGEDETWDQEENYKFFID